MNLQACVAIVRKDLVLYFSKRRALAMSIVAPILMGAFNGAIFGSLQKPSHIPVAVTDLDRSVLSRKLVADLHNDSMFDLREVDEAVATQLVSEGKVRAAIVLPAGLGRTAPSALFGNVNKPVITVRHDPSQPMALAVVSSQLVQHGMDAAAKMLVAGETRVGHISDLHREFEKNGRTPVASGFGPPFELRTVDAAAHTDRAYNSYAHAFAGMSVQFILFSGIELGVELLLAQRLGLWKRLRAAPVSRTLLIGTRIASGTAAALVLLVAIYAAAMAIFGVRIEGSAIGFFGIAITFSLLSASFGLLIAALGKTPDATRGLAILVTLVMVMLGGAWVPTFIFPRWLQTVSLAMPTRWAVDGLDAMTWRGMSLQSALGPIAILLVFSTIFVAVAMWRFDWEGEALSR